MLSCWNESPRLRPTFAGLKATFDGLLLEGRKDDYIEFDASKLLCDDQLDEHSGGPNLPGIVGVIPGLKRQSCTPVTPGDDECTLLLPNEKPKGDGLFKGNSSTHSSPRLPLSPRKSWMSKQQSPQHSRRSSLGSTRERHPSPGGRFSPKLQSPKKQQADASVAPQRSSLLLFPGRRSPKLGSGSISPQGHSPCHASNPLALDEEHQQQQQDRHRPASLFLARDQERERERERQKKEMEDRYVKEPTKLTNLTQGNSLTGLASNGGPQHMPLRRGSEGMLNMNADGYVSFVSTDYRDRRADPPPPASDIQITVTEL